MRLYLGSIYALLTIAERRRAVALSGLLVVGTLFEMLGLGLVIPIVTLLTQDDLAQRYPAIASILETFGNPSQQDLIVGAVLALVGVYFLKNLYLAFVIWRQIRFAFDVQANISQRLFTTYLRQPYVFHLQRNSAQLIRNVIGEVGVFTYHAVIPAMLLISEGLVLVGIAFLLLLIEPVAATFVVTVLIGAAWTFYRYSRARLSRWGEARQHHDGLRMQHLQQGLGGAKEVKLLGRENEFLKQYGTHNVQSAWVGQLEATFQQFPRLWLELLAIVGLAMLVVAIISQGRDIADIVPTVGLFAAAAFRLIPSVNRLLGAAQSLRYGNPVIGILSKELNLTTVEPAPEAPHDFRPFEKDIRLVGVNYTYPGAATSALKSVSISIRKGESVGLIGPSGSGKSTLVDVVLGLLVPDGGQVEVDGKDIHTNLRNWQRQIGYVPQSIFLTDDTLRRNIAFGLSDEQIDESAVWRAIRAAQLEEFVRSLPDGLATVVGERGVRVSGGQRQRIGIARALYYDPNILVLDEATASLDTVTEQNVMQAVHALHGAKTVLIVAHRLSTVEQCDRLYRLKGGHVVEEGTPLTMFPPRRNYS